MVWGLYVRSKATWLLDTTAWQQKQPELCSLTNTAFWERTLEQTNPGPCQLTNCWCSPKDKIQEASRQSAAVEVPEWLPLLPSSSTSHKKQWQEVCRTKTQRIRPSLLSLQEGHWGRPPPQLHLPTAVRILLTILWYKSLSCLAT